MKNKLPPSLRMKNGVLCFLLFVLVIVFYGISFIKTGETLKQGQSPNRSLVKQQ